MIKRRRPKCLTVVKTDVVAAAVFPEGAAEAKTLGGAQRVALVEDRVAVKVKDQGEKDSLDAARNLGGINAINDKNDHLLLLRAQKRGRGRSLRALSFSTGGWLLGSRCEQ